jgi:CDP-alcohol phosphatidyltransferase
MSKLAPADKFLDLSDYARPFGKFLANKFQNTRITPVHVTLLFGFSGIIAVCCILSGQLIVAGLFIILKSGIDAADGELARLNSTPSYFGRYLDSVFDIVLNFLFLMAICYVSEATFWSALAAFTAIQLQGTLYNYYYVILRTKSVGGDSTSKIFEYKTPRALAGETQQSVNIMFGIYKMVYGVFDKIIHALDPNVYKIKTFPNWFMTFISLYGLGFQLLIIALMLALGKIDLIIPFFIVYSILIFVMIGVRRWKII